MYLLMLCPFLHVYPRLAPAEAQEQQGAGESLAGSEVTHYKGIYPQGHGKALIINVLSRELL